MHTSEWIIVRLAKHEIEGENGNIAIEILVNRIEAKSHYFTYPTHLSDRGFWRKEEGNAPGHKDKTSRYQSFDQKPLGFRNLRHSISTVQPSKDVPDVIWKHWFGLLPSLCAVRLLLERLAVAAVSGLINGVSDPNICSSIEIPRLVTAVTDMTELPVNVEVECAR